MIPTSVSNYLFEVSVGKIPGASAVSIIGDNPSVGTGTESTVWPEGGVYSFLTAASVLKVSSDDAGDTVGSGVGAWVLLVEGLDSNYREISELVNLTGLTEATTTQEFFRVNGLTVVASGTDNKNSGIIYVGTGTVTSGKPANVYGMVSAGEGISHVGVYTVPAGKRFQLVRGAFGTASGKNIDAFLDAQPDAIGRTLVRGTTYSVVEQEVQLDFLPSEPYTEKTDIFISAVAIGGGGSGEFRTNLAGILLP
jgi:hypothetical protein